MSNLITNSNPNYEKTNQKKQTWNQSAQYQQSNLPAWDQVGMRYYNMLTGKKYTGTSQLWDHFSLHCQDLGTRELMNISIGIFTWIPQTHANMSTHICIQYQSKVWKMCPNFWLYSLNTPNPVKNQRHKLTTFFLVWNLLLWHCYCGVMAALGLTTDWLWTASRNNVSRSVLWIITPCVRAGGLPVASSFGPSWVYPH